MICPMIDKHSHPRRGDIWWINFDPSVGGEIRKRRPAVIISNDTANKVLNRVQVIPLTSNTTHLYPAECLVQTHQQLSKAMADQLTTVSTLRLVAKMGTVNTSDMQAIERITMLQLGL